jgi:hypothetical protein
MYSLAIGVGWLGKKKETGVIVLLATGYWEH